MYSPDNPELLHLFLEHIPSAVAMCDRAVIRIADNGPGMTQSVLDKLFDPFFTTKPIGRGTGLGLSVSYQIVVEKHKGQLHYTSQLAVGTEFIIEIPIRQS